MKRLLWIAVLLCLVPAIVYGVGYSGRGSLAEVDGTSDSIRVVEHEHTKLHQGVAFNAHYSLTTAPTDDHRTAIGLTTPDTTNWGHLVVTVAATDGAEFFLLEAPTIDADAGTDATIYNRHRNSAIASTMLNHDNPAEAEKVTTYTEAEIAGANFSGGTQVEYVLLATAGQGNSTIGGTSRGTQEWILKQGMKYIFMLQNVGANANTHVISLDWYEQINR